MSGAAVLIETQPGETRAARIDADGVLQALRIVRDDAGGDLVGRVYRARVRRVVPALGAAFLDLGDDGEAFLPFGKAGAPVEGSALTVRIDRPGVDGKAPRAARVPEPDGSLPHAPALLDPGPPPALRAAMDFAGPDDSILVDDAIAAAAVRAWCVGNRPELAGRVAFDPDPAGLFARAGVEDAIDGLLAPEVPLPGGGRLFIERARALTVIDVDSGGAEGHDDPDRFLRERNHAAMAEIARQLRLRAIGGQVVIDPVSLRKAGEQRRLLAALRDAVAGDPAGVQVIGATGLGLIELTRGRRAAALEDLLCAPSPPGGRRLTPATRAFAALRQARAELGSGGRPAVLVAAPEVAAALAEGSAAAAWAALVSRSGGLLSLRAEAGCCTPRLEKPPA